LQRVIDADPNFIFVKDRESRFVLVNKALADAYGSTPEGLLGKSDADFNPNKEEVEHFHKDDLEVIDNLQEKFIPEELITTATGESRWLQTVKRPLIEADGSATSLLGVATDITARKQAEAERRESQRLLQLVMDNIPQAVFWKDKDFKN
jgi:PAS domain S-box-containing protein